MISLFFVWPAPFFYIIVETRPLDTLKLYHSGVFSLSTNAYLVAVY